MRMNPGLIKRLTGLLLVALLMPFNAMAREERGRDVPIAVTAISEKVLQEVIITSELREASAQDTSISLSTMDSGEIAERGISNTRDLNHFAPNVTMTEFQGGKAGIGVNIRGLGQNETIISFDPAVGVYVDDVLIGKNIGALTDVMDLERIEILRGPQGTLYGRNTMGGTLNFVTKKPTNEFEGYISGTVGRFDQRDLKGMLNIPLLDESSSIGSLAMRISGARFNRDGLIDNRHPGAPEGELETRDRSGALVHIAWQPSDIFNALYSYDNTRIDETPFTPFTTGVDDSTGAGGALLAGGYVIGFDADRPDFVRVNGDHKSETSVDGHSVHLDFNLSDELTLKSITSHREMVNIAAADSDGSPLPIIQTRDRNELKQFTQEFRVIGSALDGGVDYVAGIFYMEEEGEIFNSVDVGIREEIFGELDNENWAIFGQATLAVTDELKVTAGLRYTDEDKELIKWGNNLGFGAAMPSMVPASDPFRAKDSYDNVSWLISASYDVNDSTMAYAKVSTGFQSGGFNIRDNEETTFNQGFEEETLLSYEVGVKSDVTDRVRVNGALWYSDYDDKRVNNFNPATLGNVVRNAGVVEIWGLELEALAQLTDQIQIGAAYGYTDPKYDEYFSPNSMGGVDDLSRITNFPYTPEHTGSIFLAFEQPVDFGVVKSRLDWAYKDNYEFLAPQPEPNNQKAYEVVNARVSLDEIQGSDGTEFRISVWGRNLTDESYYTTGVNILESFGFAINSFAEPRTYGVDVKVSFR